MNGSLPLACEAQGLAGRIEVVFEEVPSLLGAALDRTGALVAALAEVAAALDPAGRATMMAEARAVAALASRAGEEAGWLAGVGAGLDEASTAMGEILDCLARDARIAAFVAVNAQIVSRTTPGGTALATVTANLRVGLNGLDATIQGLGTRIAPVSASLRDLGDRLPPLSRTAAGLGADCTRLERHLADFAAAASLEARASRLVRDLGALDGPIAAAILRLQSGDSIRQRLEHASAILEERDRARGPLAEALDAAGRAQLAAAIEALGEAASRLPGDLARIASIAGPLEAAVTALATDPLLTDSLGTAAALAAEIAGGLIDVAEDRAGLLAPLDRLVAGCASIMHASRAISHLEERMTLLGLNAMLVSNRLREEGQAMAEVARQLREVTGRIGDGTAALVAQTRLLRDRANAMAASRPDPGDSGPTAADDPGSAGLGARAAGAADPGGMASAVHRTAVAVTRLATAVEAKGPGVTESLARAKAGIERFQASLPSPPRTVAAPLPGSLDGPARDVLARIRGLYTMESERRIHDAILNDGDRA